MISLHLIKTTVGASWALRQIKELIFFGCAVHVVLPDDSGLADDYRNAGAIVHFINVDISQAKSPVRFLINLFKFRALVCALNPDIVHSHFVGTSFFMRVALAGVDVPRIFQVPGPLHLENRFIRFLEVISASKSDYWIATCTRTREYYLESGVSPDRVGMIFYGTDMTRLLPSVKGRLRGELGLSPDVKIVGMVAFVYAPKKWLGQSRGIKGHEDLIDAMALLLKNRDDVVCVIVGGAWGDRANSYYENIVSYGTRKLGDKVYFLGSRSDVPQIYPDFDLAVHPSLSENLGGAGESLLMGIPTLATNVGGFPDIVIDGVTGWLTPPSDPEAMALRIAEALDNPEEAVKRAHAGRSWLVQELDVVKTSREVLDFYKTVIGCHHDKAHI
ncbi:MAG: glycosyltransferase family 4 protein [Moraxellaceae bacterium]|nr:glycosyltransferase family 4 protein [Moraxellaceae bacterium]